MFQIKKKTKKFQSPLPQQWLVALSRCNTPAPMEGPSCTTGRRLLRGGGGLKCLKKFLNFFKFFYFFLFLCQKNFHSPPSPDRAVVHDCSSMGAGGLECSRAINQIFLFFYFLLETFQSLLKHGALCRYHPRSIEIRLSMAERR
jgi:hypothetical protein